MATMCYFEEHLYVPGDDGLACKAGTPVNFEVIRSNFFGNHQIYLRLSGEEIEGGCMNLHLTKAQARELSEALASAELSIGYDNTEQLSDEELRSDSCG